jgi:hypothetical protein
MTHKDELKKYPGGEGEETNGAGTATEGAPEETKGTTE